MSDRDCRFDVESERFQLRAGAIILEEGCVLLVKTDLAPYYYSVGGAVRLGETAQQAAEREALEETGIPYKAERLVAVHENFFTDEVVSKGKRFHEVCLYYIMKSKGKSEITAESYAGSVREYMHWVPVENLGDHKVFPDFLRDILASPPEGVAHYITRDD